MCEHAVIYLFLVYSATPETLAFANTVPLHILYTYLPQDSGEQAEHRPEIRSHAVSPSHVSQARAEGRTCSLTTLPPQIVYILTHTYLSWPCALHLAQGGTARAARDATRGALERRRQNLLHLRTSVASP